MIHKTGLRLCLALAALAAAGCFQLDLDVALRHDGGATVTERLRVSRELLELDRQAGGPGAGAHLERAAAQQRAKTMGKGAALASHETSDMPDGGRESVAVYTIPDVEDLRLPNPFIQDRRPAPMARFSFRPITGRLPRGWSERPVLSVSLQPADDTPRPEKKDSTLPPSATPLDRQAYRDLQPIFSNLLRDFHVRVTLTAPDQPRVRTSPAGDRTLTLLYINDRHADRHAELFFQNEEAMLAMLQYQFNDSAVTDHTRHFPANPQVPVHRGRSNYGSTTFAIRPTKALQKKYFSGKAK